MSAQVIGLICEFDVRLTVSQPHNVGNGPYGRRQYHEIMTCEIEGERLSGRLLGSAGDWMLVEPDGTMRMDVRLQLETVDNAIICVRYFGLTEASSQMQQAMKDGMPTTFADQRIRTHWLLETGDPRYAWVNREVFVGEGRLQPDETGLLGFAHRIFRVDRLPA